MADRHDRSMAERRGHQQQEQDAHLDAIGTLTDRELFLVGVLLYWAEGSKSKPWRRSHSVQLINSDRIAIALFAAWLDLMSVDRERWACRVCIHESADAEAAVSAWKQIVGLGVRWMKPTLKRHRFSTTRSNVGGYMGCLVIDTAGSAQLYRAIAGAWEGIAMAAVASSQ